ncbi:MAG: methyltransferase dimerization domain-containing protein, partial [Candidatus Caldarchaeum sp.]
MNSEIPIIKDFRRPPKGVNPQTLLEFSFATAKWGIQATAVEHEIFELFSDGALTAEEVAQQRGYNLTITRYLLDALVALGLLHKAEQHYSLTPTARFFVGSLGFGMPSVKMNPFWSRLGRMLQEGSLEPLQGSSPDWSDFSTQRSMALRALGGEFHRTFELMQRAKVFRKAQTLLDLAGGHGIFSIGFKKLLPRLQVTIFEL